MGRYLFTFLALLATTSATAHADALQVLGAGSLTAAVSDLLRRFPAGADTIAPPEFGPSGLMRQKIAADVVAVLQDKALGERLSLTGQPVAPMGVEEFGAGIAEQYAQVARIAKVLGMARKN